MNGGRPGGTDRNDCSRYAHTKRDSSKTRLAIHPLASEFQLTTDANNKIKQVARANENGNAGCKWINCVRIERRVPGCRAVAGVEHILQITKQSMNMNRMRGRQWIWRDMDVKGTHDLLIKRSSLRRNEQAPVQERQ